VEPTKRGDIKAHIADTQFKKTGHFSLGSVCPRSFEVQDFVKRALARMADTQAAPEAMPTASEAAAIDKKKASSATKRKKAKKKNSDASFSASTSGPRTSSRRKSTRARRSTASSYGGYDSYGAAATAPSASFYLGMVEDGETVEMIEKKFAKLAELEAKKKAQQEKEGKTGDVALTLEEQEELFKETSNFTVSNAQRDLEDVSNLMGQDDYGWQMPTFDIDDDEGIDTMRDLMDLDDDFWDEMYEEKKASRRRKRPSSSGGGRRKRAPREPKAPKPEVKSYVCDRRGHFVTALKRVTQRDANRITYHRIPPRPLPLSWGRVIEPYVACPGLRGDMKCDIHRDADIPALPIFVFP